MRRLVKFKVEDEEILVEEMVPEEQLGQLQVAIGDQIVDAEEGLDRALARVGPVARAIFHALKGISPDEVAVEFGIRLSAKAGIIIASADAEASLKLCLKWQTSRREAD